MPDQIAIKKLKDKDAGHDEDEYEAFEKEDCLRTQYYSNEFESQDYKDSIEIIKSAIEPNRSGFYVV